jgi:hypothetical protein
MLCPPPAPDTRGSGLQQVLALLTLSISVKSELIGQWGGHFGECAAPFFFLCVSVNLPSRRAPPAMTVALKPMMPAAPFPWQAPTGCDQNAQTVNGG